MKDALKKGLSLGIGLALTSKEQAEKIIDELVKKGELSQQESKEFIHELRNKGEETQKEIDEKIKNKLSQLLNDLNVATKSDVDQLKSRIEQLEKRLTDQQ